MPNSRTSTRIVTHHQSSPRMESETSAPPVRILSAMGSRITPTSVTRFRRRARYAIHAIGRDRHDEEHEGHIAEGAELAAVHQQQGDEHRGEQDADRR